MEQDREGMPEGLALSMAMNEKAMERFYNMTSQERERLIHDSKNVRSKSEMQKLIDRMAGDDSFI